MQSRQARQAAAPPPSPDAPTFHVLVAPLTFTLLSPLSTPPTARQPRTGAAVSRGQRKRELDVRRKAEGARMMRILHEKVFKPLWDADYNNNDIGPLYFIRPIDSLKAYKHPVTGRLYGDVIPRDKWMDLPKAWDLCKKGEPPASVRREPAESDAVLERRNADGTALKKNEEKSSRRPSHVLPPRGPPQIRRFRENVLRIFQNARTFNRPDEFVYKCETFCETPPPQRRTLCFLAVRRPLLSLCASHRRARVRVRVRFLRSADACENTFVTCWEQSGLPALVAAEEQLRAREDEELRQLPEDAPGAEPSERDADEEEEEPEEEEEDEGAGAGGWGGKRGAAPKRSQGASAGGARGAGTAAAAARERDAELRTKEMTTEEKMKLSVGLQNLPIESQSRVVEIISEHNQSMINAGQADEEVELDMDNLDNVTLWKLYYFVFPKDQSRQKKRLDPDEKFRRAELAADQAALRLRELEEASGGGADGGAKSGDTGGPRASNGGAPSVGAAAGPKPGDTSSSSDDSGARACFACLCLPMQMR